MSGIGRAPSPACGWSCPDEPPSSIPGRRRPRSPTRCGAPRPVAAWRAVGDSAGSCSTPTQPRPWHNGQAIRRRLRRRPPSPSHSGQVIGSVIAVPSQRTRCRAPRRSASCCCRYGRSTPFDDQGRAVCARAAPLHAHRAVGVGRGDDTAVAIEHVRTPCLEGS